MPYRYKNRIGGSKFYFVTNRGLNNLTLFRTDEDYEKFISKLANLARDTDGVGVIAYLLERNRYNLIVEELEEGQLAKLVHRLSVSYVTYFNNRYNLKGKLFKGPYIEKPIINNEELLQAVSNIHKCPQTLGIRPIDYEWSSYSKYVKNSVDWLHKTPIGDYFQTTNLGQALKTYTEQTRINAECCAT